MCDAARLDGLRHPDVESIARLGNYGLHPQNCHRDLARRHQAKNPAPRTVERMVPMKDSKTTTGGSSRTFGRFVPTSVVPLGCLKVPRRLQSLEGGHGFGGILEQCLGFWRPRST